MVLQRRRPTGFIEPCLPSKVARPLTRTGSTKSSTMVGPTGSRDPPPNDRDQFTVRQHIYLNAAALDAEGAHFVGHSVEQPKGPVAQARPPAQPASSCKCGSCFIGMPLPPFRHRSFRTAWCRFANLKILETHSSMEQFCYPMRSFASSGPCLVRLCGIAKL